MQKTLPNQGLERRIVCNLSRLSRQTIAPDGKSCRLTVFRGNFLMHKHITNHMMAKLEKPKASPKKMSKNSFQSTVLAATVALGFGLMVNGAMAQSRASNLPITPAQKATANQVAQSGVALSELNPNAPDDYTVKRGDTLWGVSKVFLKSPWRWPELWGMNLNEIKNPHLIYPGQRLFLDKSNGRARLRMGAAAQGDVGIPTVRVSPRTRVQGLADDVISTLRSQDIEAFLAEPLVVDENGLTAAPRIVGTKEERVLLSKGDRAYARGPADKKIVDDPAKQTDYRIFRNATPLKDPLSGEILGYEAQYLGKATLVRSESLLETPDKEGKAITEIVPATIDITSIKEEIRVGDRLLPEPDRVLTSYAPRAPATAVDARVVSIYGSSVRTAAQNQVVAINRGSKDGMESGHVLAIQKAGARIVDKTDAARDPLRLPDERNGLLMVFRTFDRVSYGLILEITEGVRVGDRLVNPR
jgi:LysM repeat protein